MYPLRLSIKGSGRFENGATWLGVVVDGLDLIHKKIVEELRFSGINVLNDHGDYRPHVTIAYAPADMPIELPMIEPVNTAIGCVCVVWGGTVREIPITAKYGEWSVSAKGLPIMDFVGMNAVDAATGATLGVIEKIARFGEHGGVTATKLQPVVYIGGVVHRASDVRVQMEAM
jgi:hypothetical protein